VNQNVQPLQFLLAMMFMLSMPTPAQSVWVMLTHQHAPPSAPLSALFRDSSAKIALKKRLV
jgi:hypothetical protein